MAEPKSNETEAPRETESPNAPPPPKARARAIAIFTAFIVLQLVAPLTYYLRDDAYDERFAWRMFSAVRLYSCQPGVLETHDGNRRPVNLDMAVHRGWITQLSRNRRDVIVAFLARRCAEEGVSEVELTNRCVDHGGQAMPALVFREDCDTGELTLPEPVEVAEETP